MSDDTTRSVIAIVVIVAFFALVTIILMGFVDIASPEIAKLVGLLVGYIVAMMNPIIMRYFKHDGVPP